MGAPDAFDGAGPLVRAVAEKVPEPQRVHRQVARGAPRRAPHLRETELSTILHDATVDRTTDGEGNIWDLTLCHSMATSEVTPAGRSTSRSLRVHWSWPR